MHVTHAHSVHYTEHCSAHNGEAHNVLQGAAVPGWVEGAFVGVCAWVGVRGWGCSLAYAPAHKVKSLQAYTHMHTRLLVVKEPRCSAFTHEKW
jgi:hypothetical protein